MGSIMAAAAAQRANTSSPLGREGVARERGRIRRETICNESTLNVIS